MNGLHELKLSHFGRDVLAAVRDVPSGTRGKGCYKPPGLWVSVDGEDDWPSWCEAESFGIGKLRHRITLAPAANILLLTTAAEVFALGKSYPGARHEGIDWPRVAEQYDGIIIAPYQWPCRIAPCTNWYYGWDCASGVIWKARAIASVELIDAGQKQADLDDTEGRGLARETLSPRPSTGGINEHSKTQSSS